MADQVIRMSLEEFEARMRAGGSPTPDDVGVKTFDGRHLKTKEEILGWLAEIEADRAAGRLVDLSAEAVGLAWGSSTSSSSERSS